jgi:Ca-activated chloride channel family protein
MRHALRPLFVLLSALAPIGCDPPAPQGQPTVASIEVVRPVVEVQGAGPRHPVALHERLAQGATVSAAEHAQALLRHDGGARILLQGGAALEVTQQGARLSRGKVWVDAGPGATLEVNVGPITVLCAGGAAGFEAASDPPSITVLRGEVAWRGPGDSGRGLIRAGERGVPGDKDKDRGGLRVAPVVLFDDWTGGLGWPDPRAGRGASGLGEVGARRPGSLGEARFPLTVQRLQVRTRVVDDLAITTVEQTFFNPADATLEGIFRLHIPQGAILSRFAIDRHGRLVDGYVKERETARQQYQSQVYEGSTHDPALLEWEAPGTYKARLYPLPPGAKRRILFTYSEWLAPHGESGTLRTYRYPMAPAGATAPLLGELDIEIDARDAGAKEVRAGLGAIVPGSGPGSGSGAGAKAGPRPRGEHRVLLQRTDYQPSADLVVELLGPPRAPDEARAYRVPHRVPERPGDTRAGRRGVSEDDYVLIRALPLADRPADKREPLDVVLLVDLSAATDATHLAMARTLAESLLLHLNPEDRVALLGADLDLHPVGDQKGAAGASGSILAALTPERREQLLSALGRARTAGATDLGATLSAAAALLTPERLGAVIYLGDAQPTVGELDLPALRERLLRLPTPLRLYGVGVGAEADLALLSGLCQVSAGLAFRVSDRAAAAEAALGIVGHLSRPAMTGVSVNAGADVDRVFPRPQQPVSVLGGEPLSIVARARRGVPKDITVAGTARGQAIRRTLKVREVDIPDTADVRLRWAEARLLDLLQSGMGTEAVAELGVRQNLITPYTSFYVPSEDEIGALLRELPDLRTAGCAKLDREAAPAQAPAPVSVASGPRGAAQEEARPRAMKSEGQMGKRESAKKEGRFAIARDEAASGAEAPGSPPPPPAAAPAAAAVPMPEAVEPMVDDQKAAPKEREANNLAEALGGLVGTGVGGGGTGEGTIGLGNLGAIGRGGGRGDYGKDPYKGEDSGSLATERRAPPRPALRSRAAAAPGVTPGDADVRGAMDKDLIRRIVRRHINEVKFCYEKGLARNPALQGRVLVQFTIGPAGAVLQSAVQSSTLGSAEVEACLVQAVRRWDFPRPAGGGSVIVAYPFVLRPDGLQGQAPPARAPALRRFGRRPDARLGRRPPKTTQAVTPLYTQQVPPGQGVTVVVGIVSHRPRGCSPASGQPLDERIELWRERLEMRPGVRRAQEVWQDALQGCELRRFTDRRELLKLMLRSVLRAGGAAAMVQLYQHFAESPEEQDFLRKAILGEVKTPRDLRVIYDGMGLGDEERAALAREVATSAQGLPERLRRVRELLARWPQDLRLKLLRMETEELLGQKDAARRTAQEVQRDPLADAQARTAVGELYLRLGDEQAARRTFSEIVEFAPRDPLARRRLGDLYRAHGWFPEAQRQYQTLVGLVPGDLAVLVLQALSALGAGQLEQGLGLLERVSGTAEPGVEVGPGLPRAALLLSGLRLALLREEARKASQAEQLARLQARARRNGALALARPLRVFLTWAHPEADVELRVAPLGEGLPPSPANELWPQLGFLAWSSAPRPAGATGAGGELVPGEHQIEVRRGEGSRALTYDAELIVVRGEGSQAERVFRAPLRLSADRPALRFVVRQDRVEAL